MQIHHNHAAAAVAPTANVHHSLLDPHDSHIGGPAMYMNDSTYAACMLYMRVLACLV